MRALREIYLKAFQIAIREGQPWALMTSYNRVNGEHASESSLLLQDILRGEWGFDGLAMSDWYGTYSTEKAVKAGLGAPITGPDLLALTDEYTVDLEMPGGPTMRGDTLARALAVNKITEEEVDTCVRRVLTLANRAIEAGIPFRMKEGMVDTDDTRALLKKAAYESVVLLKNDKAALPLDSKETQTLAIIGPGAKLAHVTGGGSASLKPIYSVTAYAAIEELVKKAGQDVKLTYAAGAFTDRYLPLVDGFVEKSEFTLQYFDKDPAAGDIKPVHTKVVDTALAFMVGLGQVTMWSQAESFAGRQHSLRCCSCEMLDALDFQIYAKRKRYLEIRSLRRVSLGFFRLKSEEANIAHIQRTSRPAHKWRYRCREQERPETR